MLLSRAGDSLPPFTLGGCEIAVGGDVIAARDHLAGKHEVQLPGQILPLLFFGDVLDGVGGVHGVSVGSGKALQDEIEVGEGGLSVGVGDIAASDCDEDLQGVAVHRDVPPGLAVS